MPAHNSDGHPSGSVTRLRELVEQFREKAALSYKAAKSYPARSHHRKVLFADGDAMTICADHLEKETDALAAALAPAVVPSVDDGEVERWKRIAEMCGREADRWAMKYRDLKTAPPVVAPVAAPVQEKGNMTFETFSAVNRRRCESPEGFNHALASWTTSDWFLAVVGELGEAANVAKKLNRVRDGIPGNKETADALRDKLRQELGDAFVYLDLLAQSLGVNIGAAGIEVFNAKSDEIGCPIKMASPSLPLTGGRAGLEEPPILQLFERLEIALYGKAGNTWEVGQAQQIMDILRDATPRPQGESE